MRLQSTVLPLFALFLVFITSSESRRVKIQPRDEEEDDTVEYYAAEPQEEHQRVVLVSSADQYNGLYGQPTASSRSSHENHLAQSRGKALGAVLRTKEPVRTPPVQTIRNYNKVNDDGSFTFGYEAADGSFKEETRGTDCVVRGKYGYVDPDGNKREFTYVSGNPCDPNAPKDDQEDAAEPESNERETGPANYPTRPIRPVLRPLHATPAPKPAITLFQNNYEQGEEEQPEPEQVLRQQPIRRPTYVSRNQYSEEDSPIYQRPQLVHSTTPSSALYRQSITPLNITPRPATASPTAASSTKLPATTYRPQLLQVAVTPRPSLLYTKQFTGLSSTAATPLRGGNIDFDAEFQRFQQENNIVSPTPDTLGKSTPKGIRTSTPSAQGTSGQIYSSALIYDPQSGQYNTQLYQTLPQTEGDFTLNQRIQPYVHQPQRQAVNIQQLQQQSPLYTSQLRPQTNPQALYQQQQAEAQFQNSAQLFAQQQRARHQGQAPRQAQPVYYFQPSSVDGQNAGLGSGQIEAFLRGHNIQF